MNNYILRRPLTTRVLNIFRRIFTIPILENVLVKNATKHGSWFAFKLVPPDYLYKKGSVRTVVRDGIKYQLDISHVVDHFIYFGIKDLGYYTILDAIRGASVILDIGANIGNSSLFFASHNSRAKIFSFEPHPETFKRAQINIGLNNFSNIKLYNLGLGEEKTELKLYEVNEHNSGMNRILNKDLNMPYKLVEIDRLDSFVKEASMPKVDIIKIDVEGYEYSVLKGGEEAIKRNYPLIFIELDDDNLKGNNRSAKELIQLLICFGYNKFIRADTNSLIDLNSQFSGCHYDMVAIRVEE